MFEKLLLAVRLINISILRNEYNIPVAFIILIFYIYSSLTSYVSIFISSIWIFQKLYSIFELVNQKNSVLYICTPQQNKNYTYLRSSKNNTTKSKLFIKKNSILQVINQDDEWLHVIHNNLHGWVPKDELTPVIKSLYEQFVRIENDFQILNNIGDIVQAYQQPNEHSSPLFKIINEEMVLILSLQKEWIQIQTITNQGWIKLSKIQRLQVDKQLKEKIQQGFLHYLHFDPLQLINKIENKDLCDICLDKQKNCLFVPCNHLSTCFDCGESIFSKHNPNCVICRQPIKKLMKIFVS